MSRVCRRMVYLGELEHLMEGVRGVGEDSEALLNALEDTIEHYFVPISRQRENPRLRFLELKAEWEAETATMSSLTDIAMHPAYQKIIGMGQTALPLILGELRKKPGHWFWALKSITGEDPTSPEQMGRIEQMAEAWIRWGVQHGHLPE
jgi:hypothetical protein